MVLWVCLFALLKSPYRLKIHTEIFPDEIVYLRFASEQSQTVGNREQVEAGM